MPNIQYVTLRLWAVLKKEFIQMKRDFATYIFLIMMPLFQVVFFGYIINADAKNLPTLVVAHDNSPFTNSLIQAFKNTQYFDIKRITVDDNEGKRALKSGEMQFVINIPENFSRDLLRNKNPHILVEGDASDPIAVGSAFNASVRLDIRRTGAIKKGDEVIGSETKVKVVKNKVAPPFREAFFDILYGEGISRLGEIIELGSNLNFVEKSGAWYSYQGERIGQGKENARQYLKENPKMAQEIEAKIREHMLKKPTRASTDNTEALDEESTGA